MNPSVDRNGLHLPHWLLQDLRISLAARLEYAVILCFTNTSGYCEIGLGFLASAIGISKSLARKAVNELQRARLVFRVPGTEQGGLMKLLVTSSDLDLRGVTDEAARWRDCLLKSVRKPNVVPMQALRTRAAVYVSGKDLARITGVPYATLLRLRRSGLPVTRISPKKLAFDLDMALLWMQRAGIRFAPDCCPNFMRDTTISAAARMALLAAARDPSATVAKVARQTGLNRTSVTRALVRAVTSETRNETTQKDETNETKGKGGIATCD